MKERPIIMGPESNRGIHAGRKTQTRRVAKQVQAQGEWRGEWPDHVTSLSPGRVIAHFGNGTLSKEDCEIFAKATYTPDEGILCPHGQPGDRLWVKEVWRPTGWDDNDGTATCMLTYQADGAEVEVPMPLEYMQKWAEQLEKAGEGWWDRWRSPRFMPRWACRTILEVTDVRVERLQDITSEDARREGFGLVYVDSLPGTLKTWGTQAVQEHKRQRLFGYAWDQLNTKRGFPWSSNPYVWALTFGKLP